MKMWKVPRTASAGYAIAPVFVVENVEVKADERLIDPNETEQEIKRFEAAIEKAQKELLELASDNDIFAAHYALAGDAAIHNGVVVKIREQSMNAEAALMQVCEKFAQIFDNMDNEYMRERAADMRDIARRILYALKGISDNPFADISEKSIIVAKDLAPSDTAKMNFDLVAGFVTEAGGVTSHVSIIAKNQGIPCLVGAEALCAEAKEGMLGVLDAQEGVFYLEPDGELVKKYEKKAQEHAHFMAEVERLGSLPAKTLDGRKFRICANVGSPADIKNALNYQIDGVGLFRSEFLYMENTHFPTEEEQFQAYKNAAELLEGRELTIRTLDIGGDKGLEYYEFPKEENPFLGYRAIRMCLAEPAVFKTQLRAILRASIYGDIRIMFPMVISVEELRAARALLGQCMEELSGEGIAYNEQIQTGIMIETPAAVWMADEFAELVDFFSIGTNDLTQYILAVDRGNPRISDKYDPFHPAVLRAIAHTIEAAHRHDTTVGMCGEFAGDERAAGILLGMGLDEFSVSAISAAKVKYRLRNVSYEEMRSLAGAVLGQSTAGQVTDLLKQDEE